LLARNGDIQALAALLERCRPSLYATAIRLLANRADALDAVQDTYVVALLRLGELRDLAAARAWLHSVVRNICLMRLRRQREIVTPDIEVRDTVPGPEQVLDEHAMRDWVWQAPRALDPG
jgi:RNA polymerase sigma-70 factor (ECF subfamily)